MLFYRSPASAGTSGPSLATIRTLVTVSLLAYPAGALTRALHAGGTGGLRLFEIAGLGLILVSLLTAAPVVGSYFQKIVGDKAGQLDEFELKLRQRALSSAYGAFTVLTLVAVIYAAIASDAHLWIPRTYDEFNGLFWGVFLYASLLPTAFLVWSPASASELADSNTRLVD